MGLVLGLALAIWALGAWMRVPGSVRLAAIAALWAAVMLAHLVLPEGNGLRVAVGGSARVWAVLGGAVALGLGYGAVVRRLRRRLAPVVATVAPPSEAERYARHIMLREIGGPGQKKLRAAKVLVIGAGGLGSSALLYLAASGVGCIGVIDDDVVEVSNLQRQIIHSDARLGMAKVQSATIVMRALNPLVEVRPYNRRLTEDIAAELVAEYDLVLDGSDNFDTRYLVNRVCVTLGKPLISAAITQWEGQIGLYDPARGGPCYECVFPLRPAPGVVPTCAEAGVAAPLPGVIGAMMALEAVKEITGAGQGLRGRLVIFDGLYGESRVIGVQKRQGCAVCGGSA
ncbi:HesA/MoeB/ThiF family protein [Rhodobacter ferrooxidans]|uniref:Molybdopterin-synthase adenylyltransferase n=1 Tax=Rhodobacter ferrooxidans TaxID=371731 RepID=C8RWB9_9RHOB|nr:HesA/MoeB/ThiF family protein [Rhodobacter sp. SW2]EEW26862.1 UBA/THIF-type NAD/FAD binding protein [Rhodobacter sp. SW2]